MSAPILYFLVKNLLEKGEDVEANFVMHRYSSTPITGSISRITLNKDDSMVLTVRINKQDVEFCTMDEWDAGKLELKKDGPTSWTIVNAANVPKEKPVWEVNEAKDDDTPLIIMLLQKLLDQKEEPFIKAGQLRYTLQSLKKVERPRPLGIAPPESHYWKLIFSGMRGTLERRIETRNADDWTLKRHDDVWIPAWELVYTFDGTLKEEAEMTDEPLLVSMLRVLLKNKEVIRYRSSKPGMLHRDFQIDSIVRLADPGDDEEDQRTVFNMTSTGPSGAKFTLAITDDKADTMWSLKKLNDGRWLLDRNTGTQ